MESTEFTLIDELKEYLRVDGEDEDRTLNTFIKAAQLYLSNAGIKQPKDYYLVVGNEDIYAQHRLAILMLATHTYENRLAVSNSSSILPFGLESLILQLKVVDVIEVKASQIQ